MKVITEEAARGIVAATKEVFPEFYGVFLEEVFRQVMQEIDTLTVSKLRPMCEDPEVPKNKMSAYVLLYTRNMSVPRISRFDLHNGFDADAKRDGVGWLYLPIYK